jgi:hypothetical protein
MHAVPPLVVMDYIGPALGAIVYILALSLPQEPTRRTLNALIVAGASSAYLAGGFGLWELAYPVVATPIVYAGLRSYRWLAVGWLAHAGWDTVHFIWGNPIWPFMPTSSFGCMIFDATLAAWFLSGAPSWLKRGARDEQAAYATGLRAD